jgi:hypothetical protein
MKKIIFASLSSILFFVSCKKDTGSAPQNTTGSSSTQTSAYLPAKVGNYWVYEAYTIDSMNVETDLNHVDSMWIDRDSVANGVTYHHFATVNPSSLFTSMSALGGKWAKDSAGSIWPLVYNCSWFDPAHFNDTMRIDSVNWGFVFYTVPASFAGDITPAGTYSGISIGIMIRRESPARNYPRPATFTNFSAGTGLVHFKSSFASNPMAGNVWRLKRYHLN